MSYEIDPRLDTYYLDYGTALGVVAAMNQEYGEELEARNRLIGTIVM